MSLMASGADLPTVTTEYTAGERVPGVVSRIKGWHFIGLREAQQRSATFAAGQARDRPPALISREAGVGTRWEQNVPQFKSGRPDHLPKGLTRGSRVPEKYKLVQVA